MTDPLTDMLNRIRNAQAVFLPVVNIPFSNLKYEVAKILGKQGFIKKAESQGKKNKKVIEITLKYEEKRPGILGLKRVSKPGQRIYVDSKNIKRVRGGYGMAIISTSQGLMTDREAKRNKLGGEVICQVW